MKLHVIDKGDESVGICGAVWILDVPFYKEDVDYHEYFKREMILVYEDFCAGKCVAYYDFEMEEGE